MSCENVDWIYLSTSDTVFSEHYNTLSYSVKMHKIVVMIYILMYFWKRVKYLGPAD
jgi:hypothetical protein